MPSTNFKVIVVGGGPVGLTAAHALTRAGIDFVVLESRPTVVINAGSNLVLLPTGMRILAQLGLLDALNAVSSPLAEIKRFDHAGRRIGDSNIFVHFGENHGVLPRVISRHLLTKVMYEALPEESRAKMQANKRVSGIENTAEGVVVRCRDGSEYEGSVIIGADGAHSFIRQSMRALALEAAARDPASSTSTDEDNGINEEQPFLTTYRALWVRFPTQADLKPGHANETHGRDAAIQLFAGEDTSVIGIYERFGEPTRESARFGPADEDAFVERWGHLPISGELTVADAYASREQAGMVNLEEGVVKHWSWETIVLVGDAAHKFTPSTGAGCNNGIVDVAVLISELHEAVASASAAGPSKARVSEAFRRYQDGRYEAVAAGCAGAGQATAAATWKNAVMKFVDQRVMSSHRVQRFVMERGAPAIARTPVLSFIRNEEMAGGKYPWVRASQPSVQTV